MDRGRTQRRLLVGCALALSNPKSQVSTASALLNAEFTVLRLTALSKIEARTIELNPQVAQENISEVIVNKTNSTIVISRLHLPRSRTRKRR